MKKRDSKRSAARRLCPTVSTDTFTEKEALPMLRAMHVFPGSTGDEEICDYIRSTLLPLLAALPGSRRLEWATHRGAAMGTLRIAAVVDQYFDDEDAMNAAMASPAGKALAREVMANPRQAPELFVCEVGEMQ